MMKQSADRVNEALLVIREQLDRCIGTHPNDRFELLVAAEPSPVSAQQRKEFFFAVHNAIACCGEPEEDLDGYWIVPDDGQKFALRYLGDRNGRDEFLRIMDEIKLAIASVDAWQAARPISMAAIVCYLGLWHPMPLLRTQFDRLCLKTSSSIGQEVPKMDGCWLKVIQLTPVQNAFMAVRSAIDWIVDPTASMLLRNPIKYPTKLLPDWETLRGLFEDVEARSGSVSPMTADLEQPLEDAQSFDDGLVLERFYIEHQRKRCVLTKLEYDLLAFLRPEIGKYVPLDEIMDGVWGDVGKSWKNVVKRASILRGKLKAAHVKGITIDSRKHGYLKFAVI